MDPGDRLIRRPWPEPLGLSPVLLAIVRDWPQNSIKTVIASGRLPLKCGIVTACLCSHPMASTPARSKLPVTASMQSRLLSVSELLPLSQWFWPCFWLLLLVGSGLFCGAALMWLTRIPAGPDCDRISPLSAARDMLYCAKQRAYSGDPNDLKQAVMLTVNWPKTALDSQEAAEVLTHSSEQMLLLANRWAQAGKVEAALDLAAQVPLGSPLRKSAQTLIYDWRTEWTQGQAIEADLKAALAGQDWHQARLRLQSLKGLTTDYWLATRTNFWQQQIQIEQNSWQQWQAARRLAATADLQNLRQAIGLARAIDLRSQVWATAEQQVNSWGLTLLQAGLAQWRSGQQQAALALVQGVPPAQGLPTEAKDLLYLSQAMQLAAAANLDGPASRPRYPALVALLEAIAAVNQISADSPFAAMGRAALPGWQAQLDDLRWLKFADLVAQLGYGASYELAIRQAQRVEPGRPRRLQGQTLIADWQVRRQRLEDRPTLVLARSLAQPGTIAALQAASAQAGQIQLGRPLRLEAQTLIAEWRQEIEEIQDRPLLESAAALAQQGELRAAIVEAAKVSPQRALYPRAQQLIKDYTRTLEIAQDRPTLAKAQTLAYAGKLTAAINLAAQIAPGRALYADAKAAITLWKADRAYIWSIWKTEGRPLPDAADPNPTPSGSQ